jgi:hypothetical protein
VLQVVPWTAGNAETTKIARYRSVRLAMLEGCVELPAGDDGLVAELRGVGGKLLPSGNESIVLPRDRKGGHMDRVSAVMLGASELLLRAPQPEEYALPPAAESDAWRVEAREAVLKKRREMLRKDPMAGVRAMARR